MGNPLASFELMPGVEWVVAAAAVEVIAVVVPSRHTKPPVKALIFISHSGQSYQLVGSH